MESYDILVNRTNSLPQNYAPFDLIPAPIPFDTPSDPENQIPEKHLLRKRAAMASKELFQACSSYGYKLYGISGYRSYSRQKEIYENSIKARGLSHTRKYIAAPGESEHQTGLALDVSIASLNFDLIEDFASSKEGKWLYHNAPLYGFIIRYPKNKESITGYSYEPWHIRYVTKPLALYLDKTHLTLEEYHNLLFHLPT